MEYGIGVCGLRLGVDFLIVRIDRDPGGAGGEAGLAAVVPLHGGPGIVAAEPEQAGPEFLVGDEAALAPFLICVDALDIPKIGGALEWVVCHTQLFTLVHVGGALHHVKAGSQHFRRSFPVLRAVISEAGDGSRLVVVIQEQAVPCLSIELGLPAGEDIFQGGEGHFFVCPLCIFSLGIYVLELEDHVQLAGVLPCILLCKLRGDLGGLAYGHDIVF